MSENPDADFQQLAELAQENRIEAALDLLEQRFRDQQAWFKLFEVLKMRCRYECGLELVSHSSASELPESTQRQLEDGLLAACREVGELLVRSGSLREGWMYLQPLLDRDGVADIIRSVEVDEENLDTVIEIAVSQGAAPEYGFGLLLNHFGTCNAITTFDTQVIHFDKTVQKNLAEQLLRHLYGELCENLRSQIQEQGKSIDADASLGDLMDQHPWLFDGGAIHIDATHLASVMRIARVVDQPDDLKQALELARYGDGLHEDFQYPSPTPFESTYLDHRLYYASLLGIEVEEAIGHFESKCESVDPDQHGPVAFEVLADLLVRLGRRERAIEVMTKNVLSKYETMGIAPPVFEIAQTDSQREMLRSYYHAQGDLLGYAASVLSG